MQRLTSRRRLRLPRHKISRFRQAQQFVALRLVGLSFCYYTRNCTVLRPRITWAYASCPHSSAILNVFGLIMIETISLGCFSHAQNNHVSTMTRAIRCLTWTLFTTKHVSFVMRLIMFWPRVNAAYNSTFFAQSYCAWNLGEHLYRSAVARVI